MPHQWCLRLLDVPPLERPTWKLAFLRPPKLPIFIGSNVQDASGKPLEVILVDADTESQSSLPQALRIELVPLSGDFPPAYLEDWAPYEFQRCIDDQRQLKHPLLTGDLDLTMRDGHVTVNELQFTDSLYAILSGMFRIGVRVVPGSYHGARIQEGMTTAFMVYESDHPGELYKDYDSPAFCADWWLKEILLPLLERPTWKLAFKNPQRVPMFTDTKIKDANGNPLEVIYSC